MNKYAWLFFMISLIIVMTLAANQIETIATGLDSVESASTGELTDDTYIFSFFSTYISLLTFNVTGVPAIISLIFIPLNLIFAFIIGEVIVKINPIFLAIAAGITALVAVFA